MAEGKRILLVEDNEEIRWLVRETLAASTLPLVVREAANGHEALQILGEFSPHVLILDVMLPDGVDGYSLCQYVKSRPALFPSVFVMLLTARGQRSDQKKGRMMGADLYLVKPFSPAELLMLVDDHFS